MNQENIKFKNYIEQHTSQSLETVDQYISIYKIYLEMADRISSRRERTNSFFLSINTAIIGFIGYLTGTDKISGDYILFSLVGLSGIVLSFLWYRIIRSYRDINNAKFKIVHEIEQKLPLRPFDAEWEAVGRGKNRKLYLPFTHIEVFIPWIFVSFHIILTVRILILFCFK